MHLLVWVAPTISVKLSSNAVSYMHILIIPLVLVCFDSFMSPSASNVGTAHFPCLCIGITFLLLPRALQGRWACSRINMCYKARSWVLHHRLLNHSANNEINSKDYCVCPIHFHLISLPFFKSFRYHNSTCILKYQRMQYDTVIHIIYIQNELALKNTPSVP